MGPGTRPRPAQGWPPVPGQPWPKWTLPTLTYHASIPGRHLQGSVQQEANLPLTRAVSFYAGYIEGSALDAQYFAETLGDPESAAGTDVELLRMTGTGQWRTYPDFPSTRGFHRIGAYTTT